MRARIATSAALVLGLCVAIGPALAEECALADTVLEECQASQPPPQPEPMPQPPSEPRNQPAVTPGHVPQAVSRMLTLLNGERRSRGLPQFSLRDDVSAVSRAHSEAMAAAGTIWHNDAYFTGATKRKLDAVLLGENVARNPDIDDAHRRLMNSPGHRANIVDRRFTVLGMAVYRSSTGSLYVAQNFLQPSARAAVAKAPAAAEKGRAVAAARAAPASTTTTAAPAAAAAPEAVDVLAAGPGPALSAAPSGLPVGGHGTPVGTGAATAVLALLAAAAVLAHRFRGRFAPFVARIRR